MQDKLVAIHNLDCPWRPSDLTQRVGRIVRQGNTNKKVYIYRYVTEGTFDAYLYQLVENKQRFISQIMTSKTPVRSAEDIDEQALSYAEVKALATGNPLIVEKANIDAQVAKLKLLKQSHMSQIYQMQDMVIKHYPNEIKRIEELIIGLQEDVECLKNNTKPNADKFSPMTIKEILYTDKEKAGQAILEACKAMTSTEPIELGEYRGFKMELSYNAFSKEFKVDLRNRITQNVTLGNDVYGNIIRLDNGLGDIEGQMNSNKQLLEDTKVQLENAKQELDKPFPQEGELAAKSKRLDELNILLNLNQKDKEILDGDVEECEEESSKKPRHYDR